MKNIYFCRVYIKHERFHDNKLPESFLDIFKEKVKHNIYLIRYIIRDIFKSKLSIISKFILTIFFPFFLILKKFKNKIIKYVSIIKKYL